MGHDMCVTLEPCKFNKLRTRITDTEDDSSIL